MFTDLILGLVGAAGAASATPVIELAPDVHFVAGEFIEGQQPDGNSVLFRAPDGWIVVDTGRHREHTQSLLDVIQNSGEPLTAVINTHWHLDHIGGNVLVRQRTPHVRVYASATLEDALTGFLASYRTQLEDMIAQTSGQPQEQRQFRTELALLQAGPQLAPDEVVTRSGPRTVAGRKLMLNLEKRAVTVGDIWVLDPATGILVAGDLVTLPVPFFDTACPQRWASALRALSETGFTLLVPGHGDPMGRETFDTYHGAFDSLLACAASDQTNEDCVDGWIRDAGDLLAGEDRKRARSMLDYYMGANLRGDPANLAKLCEA